MQKKTKIIIISTILLLIAIPIIILLIQNTNKHPTQPLTEQAKAHYETIIGNEPYDITNAVLEPNEIVPTISAGMIPIKWNGTNFEITTRKDTNWYDYANGKPAYIMLNDGYYKSEIEQGITSEQLMANNVGVGVPDDPETIGTIYMWIPRFAYNDDGEILYIKQACSVAGTYTIPEIFTYETEKRDFSLAGIWIECTPLANTNEVNTKIINMQGPNNQYGFIANTIGTNANNEPSYKTTTETYNQYIANIVNGTTEASFPTDTTTDANAVGATSVRNTQENLPNVALATEEYPSNIKNDESRNLQITDVSNPNRTILKITNSNQPEPIKGNAYYDKTEEKIKIEVTYRTNAITKILEKNGKELSTNSTTADSGNEIIGNKTYKYIVIDNLGNIKEIITTVSGLDIYIIENEEDLKQFRDAVNAGKTTAKTKAYQIADVKLNEGKYTINEVSGEITFNSDAEQWVPIGSTKQYSGTYDGQGHTISGIYINTEADNKGLFGYISNSTIQNLKLAKSYINGKDNVGGIIGMAIGSTSVINCCNEAVVNSSGSKVGGIIGYANGTRISYCTISKSLNKGIVRTSSGGFAGGIIGLSRYNTINNCYNTDTITSSTTCGGIVGCNSSGNLSNCYNIGSIQVGRINVNTDLAGGIAGENLSGTINNCYNIGLISGYQEIGGIVGKNGSSSSDTTYSYIKNCVNSTEKITGTRLIGAICGYMPSSYAQVNSSRYLKTNSSLYGIGAMRNSNNVTQYNSNTGCTSYSSESSLPTIISVINGDNAFVEDTNNINNGYPILAWQAE